MFQYKGIAYRQGKGEACPWIVTFVAIAEDILTWASIPRRSEAHLLGFQRAGTPQRIDAAEGFFEIDSNQSPTSLILGFHQSQLPNPPIAVELEDPNNETGPVACTITIETELFNGASAEQKAAAIEANLRMRLASETPSEISDDDSADSDSTQTSESDDLSMQEEPIEDREVELGASILDELAKRMSDPQWIEENSELVDDLAKPATIIDGQHRVLGAARCERRIPFSVCAIVNCSWPEQVFQFTVVNYTATGIPDQFITANAALSLTGTELKGLEARLVQAGVKVVEYELMKVVNFDGQSPFFKLVNLTETSKPDLIGYHSMVRLAKAWQNGKADAISSKILENLYPEFTGTKRDVRRRAIAEWQRSDWGDFFKAFWNTIKNKYAHEKTAPEKTSDGEKINDGHSLWDPEHSQLMVAAVLLQLQATFLEALSMQSSKYFKISTATNGAAKAELLNTITLLADELICESFPPEFFRNKWKTTSLATGAGHDALEHVFYEMIKSKGKFGYASSTLVKGASS